MLLEKNNLTVDLRAIAKEKVQLQSDYMSNVDIMVTNNEKEVLKIKQELKDMYSKVTRHSFCEETNFYTLLHSCLYYLILFITPTILLVRWMFFQ